jgi:hypothetical protein
MKAGNKLWHNARGMSQISLPMHSLGHPDALEKAKQLMSETGSASELLDDVSIGI